VEIRSCRSRQQPARAGRSRQAPASLSARQPDREVCYRSATLASPMLRQARRVPPLADLRDEWIALPSPHAASSMTNPQRLARCASPASVPVAMERRLDMMPLFLKLQLSRLLRPLAHVCTRRVSPSPRLCTKSHAVRPCSPFSTCAPSTLSPLYLCAAAVPGNHPHGHCTWPLLP
jgi:hypothetical protein